MVFTFPCPRVTRQFSLDCSPVYRNKSEYIKLIRSVLMFYILKKMDANKQVCNGEKNITQLDKRKKICSLLRKGYFIGR